MINRQRLQSAFQHWTGHCPNETYHVFDDFIPENRLISVDMNEAFPTFGDEVNVVFDLAWPISKTALSITSAIEQSDIVLVPIYNEVKAINAGLNTITEVLHFNPNVIVIATKLQRRGKADQFENWPKCEDMRNISQAVHNQISPDIPVLPLKFSSVFDTIFEHEKSISELMQASGLANYQYREVADQFDAIYHLIDQTHARYKRYFSL